MIAKRRSRRNLRNGLVTSHKNLSVVLVQSTLVIANGWHVLDHDSVVWVLARLVEDSVGFNHVIDNIGLRNLLRAELLLRAQVLSIIVAKMVVASNGSELDTSTDQEIDQGGLHLGLTRLEVIATNERVVPLGKLNSTRDKCILRRTINEWSALENGSNGENSGGSNFKMAFFNGFQEVVSSVVDTLDEISKALGIGSPLNNDLVESVVGLEVTVC